ncbi:MAG: class I SAM-dependent methyltransferase [Rhodospirillales bacterium]
MSEDEKHASRHLRITEPSPWVRRFAPLIPAQGLVLDLACGGGRHTGLLLDLGYRVVAVDRDTAAIGERLGGRDGSEIVTADLEDGVPPFGAGGALSGRRFDGIVVVNYLHRPLMAELAAALKPGGVLIYETFGRGNEAFSKPRNPDHLLARGELLNLCRDGFDVVAFEHGIERTGELPGVKSRICAVRTGTDDSPRELWPGETAVS